MFKVPPIMYPVFIKSPLDNTIFSIIFYYREIKAPDLEPVVVTIDCEVDNERYKRLFEDFADYLHRQEYGHDEYQDFYESPCNVVVDLVLYKKYRDHSSFIREYMKRYNIRDKTIDPDLSGSAFLSYESDINFINFIKTEILKGRGLELLKFIAEDAASAFIKYMKFIKAVDSGMEIDVNEVFSEEKAKQYIIPIMASMDGSIEVDTSKIVDTEYVVRNGKIYRVLYEETSYKSLDDILRETKETLKRIYQKQLEITKRIYQKQIEKLKKDLEDVSRKSFIKGFRKLLEVYSKLSRYFEKIEVEEDKIVLKGCIKARRVRYLGRVVDISDIVELKDLFYACDITIDISNPEKITSVTVSDHDHPNISEYGKLCLGDLNGKPIDVVLERLPDLLMTVNLDNSYWTPSDKIMQYIKKLFREKSGEVWRV